MTEEAPQAFTKQEKCAQCGGPLNQGENWGCARAFVPVMAFVDMVVEIHQHVHIGCVHGQMRVLALGNLLRQRVGWN